MITEPWAPTFEQSQDERPASAWRAALYGRHSGPRQHSTETQIAECRKRCEERGWRARYILKDEAKSGNDGERAGFWRLLELAEAGLIDVVVVWKIDRFARNLGHAGTLEEELRSHGVCIHSVTEPIDTTTPMGRFIFGNLINAAALEREMIKERTKLGFEKSVRAGRWPRRDPPFGYRKTKGRHLRLDPDEANAVRAVFEAYLAQGSYSEAAHALNQQGCTFRGEGWTVRRVRRVLEHTIYDGHYTHSGLKVEAPRLRVLDPGTWKAAADLRNRKARNGRSASESVRDAAVDRIFAEYRRHLREAFSDR